MSPQRIQLSRAKGYRKPEGAIVVSRPSRWGNPYRVGDCARTECGHRWWPKHWHVYDGNLSWRGDWGPRVGIFDSKANAASYAVRRFGLWLNSSQARVEDLVPLLAGHDLACWCRLDQACHADVLLEIANAEVSG